MMNNEKLASELVRIARDLMAGDFDEAGVFIETNIPNWARKYRLKLKKSWTHPRGMSWKFIGTHEGRELTVVVVSEKNGKFHISFFWEIDKKRHESLVLESRPVPLKGLKQELAKGLKSLFSGEEAGESGPLKDALMGYTVDLSSEQADKAIREMRKLMKQGEDPQDLLDMYGLDSDLIFDLLHL